MMSAKLAFGMFGSSSNKSLTEKPSFRPSAKPMFSCMGWFRLNGLFGWA